MAGYRFPDELDDDNATTNQDQSTDLDVSVSTDSDVEIEIVDDTPEKDRGRKPLDRTGDDPTDDELDTYTDNVKKRIKELTHARHDERRVKEATMREKQELERLAQQLIEENKRLKQNVYTGQEAVIEGAKSKADFELKEARAKLKAAQEAYDNDAIVAALEEVTDAKIRAEQVKNFRPTPLQEENFET